MKFETEIFKARITADMVGAECLLVSSPEKYNKMPSGEIFNATISAVPGRMARSYKQLGLYWAACALVADNTDDPDWDHADKVDEQCKIAGRHIDCYIYYETENGQTLHIKTKSIGFSELEHLDACGYFDKAFDVMAKKLRITVRTLIEETKNHMGGAA